MAKARVTKKFLKENYAVINVGCGNLQNLLRFVDPSFYCTRVEGWACDAYIIGDYAIVDGYDGIGRVISHDVMKKYDNKAEEAYNKYREGSKYYTYNRLISVNNKLIDEFIKEATAPKTRRK